MSRHTSSAFLHALAAGAPMASALELVRPGAKLEQRPLDPPILNELFIAAAAEDYVRLAERALEAMRPSHRLRTFILQPYALVLTAATALVVFSVINAFVYPVFEKMYVDFGAGVPPALHYGPAMIMVVVAGALGVIGLLVAEGRTTNRELLIGLALGIVPLFWPVMIGGLVASRARRVNDPLERAVRWLAAGAVAGVAPDVVLRHVSGRPLFDRALASLVRVAAGGGDALAVARSWAESRAEVFRAVVAGQIAGDSPDGTLARLASVVAVDRGRPELGSAIMIGGFGLLVASVYLVVAPTMTIVARLGTAI